MPIFSDPEQSRSEMACHLFTQLKPLRVLIEYEKVTEFAYLKQILLTLKISNFKTTFLKIP